MQTHFNWFIRNMNTSLHKTRVLHWLKCLGPFLTMWSLKVIYYIKLYMILKSKVCIEVLVVNTSHRQYINWNVMRPPMTMCNMSWHNVKAVHGHWYPGQLLAIWNYNYNNILKFDAVKNLDNIYRKAWI